MPSLKLLLWQSADAIADALAILAIPAAAFLLLAFLAKGRQAIVGGIRAAAETRTNILLHVFDALLVGPLLALAVTLLGTRLGAGGLHLAPPALWAALPAPLVVFAAVFAGDFVGYWRHRLEHTRYLWPAHAVHHSDTQMTWLTLSRFHPFNRVTTTLLDGALLLLLGLPPYAIVGNAIVRHYYGHFVHADLPWTYGPLGRVFVSPAMHRWHHALDRAAFHTNYATVFSLFDRLFGTYRVPGPCTAPLGVTDRMGAGALNQLAYPLRPRAYKARWRKRKAAAAPPPQPPQPEASSRLASDSGW